MLTVQINPGCTLVVAATRLPVMFSVANITPKDLVRKYPEQVLVALHKNKALVVFRNIGKVAEKVPGKGSCG